MPNSDHTAALRAATPADGWRLAKAQERLPKRSRETTRKIPNTPSAA
jgi:uncharacterized membrane protein